MTTNPGGPTPAAAGAAPDSQAAVPEILQVARDVLSDLDLEAVLQRVLEAARRLTGARYAAVGVLDDRRQELERFITVGIDEDAHREIGSLPRGRGVLGELIAQPVPLRLDDVGAHPRSFGFPAGHPAMKTFLGVPLIVGGTPYGNLYLTEKVGGARFTEADERALLQLADFAGVAIDHARRYSGVERQRRELERTVQALDATVQIARAVGGETDLGLILELVAKRGRALVSARALVIEHRVGEQITIAAGAGELPPGLLGQRLESHDTVASLALRTLRTLRLEDAAHRQRFRSHGLGRFGIEPEAGLVVPLLFRGAGLGVLVALDRLEDGPAFTADDIRLLEAFAASAATAIATARSVEADARAQRIAAAEQERGRWARELHDETLQNLAALRIGISGQLRSQNAERAKQVMEEALEQIDTEIANLRALVTELRPTALDDLGIEAALEDLAARAERRGLTVALSLDFNGSDRHRSDLETAIYRIIQEAITNATKHGSAEHAWVEVAERDGRITISVRDDGSGFDTSRRSSGFGMTSMRERAELVGGVLGVQSAEGEGTTVLATLPATAPPEALAS